MINLIVALLLIFVLPGIGLSFYIFYDSRLHEKIIFGIGLSLLITIMVGFILGGNETLKNITGGYTYQNILVSLILFSVLGLLLNILRWKK